MPVLYRKYRPQTFADVTGQEHVTRTILAALGQGRSAHAYLFSGPRGVGKTTTARLLAKAVNCEHAAKRTKRNAPQGEPCNTCTTCAEIAEGRCLDVVEIDAASHTQVEHLREHVIDVVRVAPASAARKVFIIDEVHMLSKASFNALLKTLEEPPPHVLFILATTELDRVPETIRSRCQHFTFRRVVHAVLVERLRTLAAAERVRVAPDVLDAVARAADGSVRDAESLLGQLFALGGNEVTSDDAALVLPHASPESANAIVDALAVHNCAAGITALRSAEERGVDAEALLRAVVENIRVRIHAAIGSNGPLPLVEALRATVRLLDQLARSEDPFLALEATLIGLLQTSPASDRARPVIPPAAIPQQPRPQGVPAAALRSEAVVPAAPADDVHALAKIRAAWSALLRHVSDQNHSLPYLLEGGRPKAVSGGVCTLGFKYKLHAEKVRAPALAGAVADAIAAVAEVTVRIAAVVVSAAEFAELDAAVRSKTGDAVADAALEVFGGRVVE